MQIDSKNIVSISEANQNFSKIARMVDDKKRVLILKNNQPKYMVIDFDEYEKELGKLNLERIADEVLKKNKGAFERLSR